MDSGGIFIDVPSGFSAAQGSSGAVGYTTITTAGTLANVEDAADAVGSWVMNNACTNGITADTGTKHEGAAAIKCANGNEGSGDLWRKTITAANWTSYTKIGFWIRSSAALAAGNLDFAYDNSTNLGSPIESIDVPALSANTWTYVVLTFGATTRTSVQSYGFIVRSGAALDNVNVWFDDILLGPGSASFSGGDMSVRLLRLSSGETVSFSYGAGGGSSGVTAPGTDGVYTFTTQTRADDSGVLASISSSPSIVVSTPIAATKFVIVDPVDTVVGGNVSVTVRAEDNSGNLDTTYQNDVTLVADGSATGEGLVSITNGVGTKTITDTVAETVNLILSDSQGTGLNVASTQNVVFSAVADASQSGASIQRQLSTVINFYGRAYPGATVTVLARSGNQEIPLKQQIISSVDGSFGLEFKGDFAGYYSYGLKVNDKDGRAAPAKFYDLDLSLYSVTDRDIFVPPTLSATRQMIAGKESIIISGYAAPKNDVMAEIDGKIISDFAIADGAGFYKLILGAENFSQGQHNIRVRQINNYFGKTSDWSLLSLFIIPSLGRAETDFNADDIIDIKDWSIFLSYWGKRGEERRKIDLNGDGTVDISDFSLFVASFKK